MNSSFGENGKMSVKGSSVDGSRNDRENKALDEEFLDQLDVSKASV